MRSLLSISLLVFSHATYAAITIADNCDANGKPIKEYQAPDSATCANDCDQNAACNGFTFISDWNHCSLKADVTRTNPVKMISANIEVQQGVRTVIAETVNADNKGKDLRKHVVKTVSECREKCLASLDCAAFTFIEGYDNCWIKGNAGRIVAKIFYCGRKF